MEEGRDLSCHAVPSAPMATMPEGPCVTPAPAFTAQAEHHAPCTTSCHSTGSPLVAWHLGEFGAGSSAPAAPGSSLDALAQDVAAHEVELRVLRADVEAKELEAAHLRTRAKDADVVVMSAAGSVGALSVRVETTATNQQAVLEACHEQIHIQADTLRRRLARMEWELSEKDEEIELLRQLSVLNREMAERQRGEVTSLQMSQEEQGLQMFQLAQDAGRIQRHRAIGEWQQRVCAKVSRENTNAALSREQRGWRDEIAHLNKESDGLRDFIRRMDERCRDLVAENERARQHYNALGMEERMSDTAARFSQDAIDEPLRERIMEQQALERQLQEEAARKPCTGIQPPPKRASPQERVALMARDQLELRVLAACIQEMSRALTETAPGRADSDATDAAVRACLARMARIPGSPPLPPIVRVGASDYAVGGELLQCALVRGQLFARLPRGSLAPFEDVMRVHAMSSASSRLLSSTGASGFCSAARSCAPTATGVARRAASPPATDAFSSRAPLLSAARPASPLSLRVRRTLHGQPLAPIHSLGGGLGSAAGGRYPSGESASPLRFLGRV